MTRIVSKSNMMASIFHSSSILPPVSLELDIAAIPTAHAGNPPYPPLQTCKAATCFVPVCPLCSLLN
jgi:hypothetical protein